MTVPRDAWTWVLVTAVTLLVWSWAASETRDTRRIPMRIALTVPDAEAWLIEPSSVPVTITAEGSLRALRQAEEHAQRIQLTLSPSVGTQVLDIRQELERHPDFRAIGVTIESLDQPTQSVDLDKFVHVQVPVRHDLPGVQTEGTVTLDPARVELTLPSAVHAIFLDSLYAVAAVPRTELDRLPPGRRHTLENRMLRVPELLRGRAESIRMTPPAVDITFTIRSQIEQLALENPVRIELSGPPEDHGHYEIEFEPKQLTGVTVEASSEIIRMIREGQARVFAQLRLKSTEKDARLATKAVSCFQAELPDGQVIVIDATVDGAEGMPSVRLTITPLAVNPESSSS